MDHPTGRGPFLVIRAPRVTSVKFHVFRRRGRCDLHIAGGELQRGGVTGGIFFFFFKVRK